MPDSDERSTSDTAEQQKKDLPLPAPEEEDPTPPKTELESIFEVLGFDKDHELFEKILGQYELIKQQGIMEVVLLHPLVLYMDFLFFSLRQSIGLLAVFTLTSGPPQQSGTSLLCRFLQCLCWILSGCPLWSSWISSRSGR